MKKILGDTIASKVSLEGLRPGITSEELLAYVPEIGETYGFIHIEIAVKMLRGRTLAQIEFKEICSKTIYKKYWKVPQ